MRVVFDRGWALVETVYPKLLSGALSTSWLVVGAAGLLFAVSLQRIEGLGVELLPEIHQGEFTAHVALGVGTPIEVTDDLYEASVPEVLCASFKYGVR